MATARCDEDARELHIMGLPHQSRMAGFRWVWETGDEMPFELMPPGNHQVERGIVIPLEGSFGIDVESPDAQRVRF
jgi:hypothetical protein